MRGLGRDGLGFGGGLGGGLGVHYGSLVQQRLRQTKAATFCGVAAQWIWWMLCKTILFYRYRAARMPG
jgi:hypothetical protein